MERAGRDPGPAARPRRLTPAVPALPNLVKGHWPEFCSLHGAVENALWKMTNNTIKEKSRPSLKNTN